LRQIISKASDIYQSAQAAYNKNKDSSMTDINTKFEQLLNDYKKVIDGRTLVSQHKGDDKFLSNGYSKNVYTPIYNIKKLKDDLQSEILK
jgi:hypothetical protein